METLEAAVRISLAMILACGLIPVVGFLGRQITEIKNVFLGITYCILVPIILAAQIYAIAWLAAPYGSGDGPNKHLSTCATRINGLWLPGKQCTCGARTVQPCNCNNK